MNTEMYWKLVDLYAGHELPTAIEEEMEIAAMTEPTLAEEMRSLRETYDILHKEDGPEFTEETRQRILMKLYMKGVNLEPAVPNVTHFQYQLHIQG